MKASSMATKQMIDKVHESEKQLKTNFMLEFERF